MPGRKMVSSLSLETRDAVESSLLEWGVNSSELDRGRHSMFISRIVTQALVQAKEPSSGSGGPPVNSIMRCDLIELPKSFEDAIELVFTSELREYLDQTMYLLRLENENLNDSLENLLSAADNPVHILTYPPNYIDKDGIARKKAAFKRIEQFDPFKRFKLGDKTFSQAELAYHQCNKQDWRNGYAFEAIVASHAIHNEPCYSCNVKGSLFWCGGSDSSWRDLYCHSCESCFEIKSKKDNQKIDAVFRFNNLAGGSYAGWCKETFSESRAGRDYIVIVSREPSFPSENVCKDTLSWKVEIAEVNTALPRLTAMSFVDYALQKKKITLKTLVTLQNRETWFRIQEQDSLDFEKIMQRSFENVFPCQWDVLAKNERHKLGIAAANANSVVARWQHVSPPSRIPHFSGGGPWTSRTDISSLYSSFRRMSVGDDGQVCEHDYCDYDFYASEQRTTKGINGQRRVNISDKSMGLCKHNGFKMMDNGHYGSRGSKKGGKKHDSDYYG